MSLHNLARYRTIQSLPLILEGNRQADADYLDQCRAKRNITEYDSVGQIAREEADELLEFVRAFRTEVVDWLKIQHPRFYPF